MFFTHKNRLFLFVIYYIQVVMFCRGKSNWAVGPINIVARYLLNVTVSIICNFRYKFDTKTKKKDKRLFRKSGMHNVSFNFTGFFSRFYLILHLRQLHHYRLILRNVLRLCTLLTVYLCQELLSLHYTYVLLCLSIILSIIHVLVLFTSSALQAIAIITSSMLFDSFCFGLNLQKRLMCPFLHTIETFTIKFIHYRFYVISVAIYFDLVLNGFW